ncbi:MAG: prepilin-type N-terminal cleavage/methylation domain-containing protein [Egibacteraceae bacterium]
MKRLDKDCSGFTLVELLVVMAALVVVGGIVVSGVVRALAANESAEARIDALTDAHVALERMSREIRASDARDVSGGPLVVAEDRFVVADVFRDGQRLRHSYWVESDGDNARLCAEQVVQAGPGSAMPAPDAPPSDCAQTVLRHLDPTSRPFTYRSKGDSDGDTETLAGMGAGSAVDDDDMGRVVTVEITIDRPVPDRRDGDQIRVSTRVVMRNACQGGGSSC